MAIYVPPSRRRRQLLVIAGLAGLAGVLLGGAVGRVTAPSVGEQVRSSQESARTLAAALRVVAIHQEADTVSLQASADGGADLALRRAEGELQKALARAPWIPAPEQARLLGLIAGLRGGPPGQASTPEFAQRVEAAASAIETGFGVRGPG